MILFKDKYRIPSARLKGWDYRNGGAYFITICIKDRLNHFGECEDGKMILTDAGEIADKYWRTLPDHFNHVGLGEFVVMPNHIHGILVLDPPVETLHCNVLVNPENKMGNNMTVQPDLQSNDRDRMGDKKTLHCNVSTNVEKQFMSQISPKPGSVSTIVRSYKSACTKWINEHLPDLNFQWQERFHDHIIRNHEEYLRIENYIINNPGNWKEDKFYK
jgi:putative transposase